MYIMAGLVPEVVHMPPLLVSRLIASSKMHLPLTSGLVLLATARFTAACSDNNCARAVTGTRDKNPPLASRRADCSSFQLATVTPATVYAPSLPTFSSPAVPPCQPADLEYLLLTTAAEP